MSIRIIPKGNGYFKNYDKIFGKKKKEKEKEGKEKKEKKVEEKEKSEFVGSCSILDGTETVNCKLLRITNGRATVIVDGYTYSDGFPAEHIMNYVPPD